MSDLYCSDDYNSVHSFTIKEQMLKNEIRNLNINGEGLLFLVWVFIFIVGFLIYNK